MPLVRIFGEIIAWIHKADVKGRFGPLVLLGLVAAGCTVASISNLPTPYPTEFLPTLIALTVNAADQVTPEKTPSLTATSTLPPAPSRTPTLASSLTPSPTCCTAVSTSTRTPTPTRTATATPELPIADIQFFRPGPASRVVSPLRINAYLWPGAGGKVRVELLGEDGRLLVRKVLAYSPTNRVHVITDLDFEIEAVAEAGRLQVSTEDSSGRIIALASVDLILLSLGDEDLNPPADGNESIVIREPVKNTLIQGGSVVVSGLAIPAGDQPLLVELIATDGRVVGYRQAALTPVEGTGYTSFTVDVPYSVTSTTWVRLTISETSGRIPGRTHISSIEVLLSP